MSPDGRFVFDNSVIVSALLLEHSVPGQAFYAGLALGEILISRETFNELTDVLSRNKFDRYVTHQERDEFMARLLRETTMIDVSEAIRACRDPKDDRLLELAVSGRASVLISSDQDLLTLHPFRGIPIVNSARFLEFISQDRLRSK